MDPTQDEANCGQCGTPCAAGQACVGGTCTCQAPLTACAGACVNTQESGSNCGSCGATCPTGQVCSGGACRAGCAANFTQCGSDCVDVSQSVLHCGSCSAACPTGLTCTGGSCGCAGGLTPCNGACPDLSTDATNCGTCGNVCAAGQTCRAGACACPNTGEQLCGTACVNPQTDRGNCGACGNVCAANQTCSAGACVGSANTGGVPGVGGATGGVQGTGGAGTGGLNTGGVNIGGFPTGGMSTGGMNTGGFQTGGTSTGGMNTGGFQTGGTSTGGVNTGGMQTGGMNTGGSAGGTTAGLGAWTTGYVATMYGNTGSGDCSAYGNSFSDSTAISTYTCVLGNGPRKVSLSTYQPGTANNSSYYAALGDLSSLWTANGNASQCACNGSTTATCGGPSCNAEISSEGACGICIAVKCDPDSTYKDSSGYSHNSNCNTSQYVVVQNIDACPHNHTTNVGSSSGWCTSKQAQHIDLSCSGLGDISNLGTNVGQVGWLGVSVQVVDCSVGLGKHSL